MPSPSHFECNSDVKPCPSCCMQAHSFYVKVGGDFLSASRMFCASRYGTYRLLRERILIIFPVKAVDCRARSKIQAIIANCHSGCNLHRRWNGTNSEGVGIEAEDIV